MVTIALFVRIEAKPGQEAAVEQFLRDLLQVVEGEPATIAWFGLRLVPSAFGIFDAFPDEAGRSAHLSGRITAALMSDQTLALLAEPPAIAKLEATCVSTVIMPR